MARALLREPDLPIASHDEVSRELKLLVDRREDLVAQRTSTINRLLWRVHELDPERAPSRARWTWPNTADILGDWLATQPGLVAELARDELADITRLTEAINALAKRIGERVRRGRPDAAGAAGLRGVDRGQTRRRSRRSDPIQKRGGLARHAGVAPIPVWSGNTAGRVRMTRSGNRQLNAALHRIAVTQIRLDGLGQTYYRKRIAAGDSNHRSTALPQTPPVPRRLRPPAHRPPKPNPALPTGSGLT